MEHLRKKITILVTHQLQYLQRADRILLMKAGRVVAVGTMSELTALGHTFTDILAETEMSYKRHLSSDSMPRSPKKIVQEMELETNLDDATEEDRLLLALQDKELQRGEGRLSSSLTESAWSLAMGKVRFFQE
jgi:ABC-type multidrug transport system ATPase subunit